MSFNYVNVDSYGHSDLIRVDRLMIGSESIHLGAGRVYVESILSPAK